MRFMPYAIIGSVLLALAGPSALALTLGDPAPALQAEKWLKGDPVDLKDGKGEKIYVVEFWATWCRPCKKFIPHLTELQKKHKDDGLVIIGITDESPKKAEPFVKKMGDKMDYAVMADKSKKTYNAYMGGFGIRTIPHAFVVNKDGNIVWQGNPMQGLDGVIEKVLKGTWDLATAKKEEEMRQNQMKAQKMLSEYLQHVMEEDGDHAKADAIMQEAWPLIEDNPMVLFQVAEVIMTLEDIKHRDLELAMKAAKKANQLSEGKEPIILATLARAHEKTGNRDKAHELLKKAVELAEDPRAKMVLEARLKEFEAAGSASETGGE